MDEIPKGSKQPVIFSAHGVAKRVIEKAKNCEEMAKAAFSDNSSNTNLPTIKIDKKNFKKEFNIIDLIILSNLEKSRSEIRRLVRGNAVKINNEIIEDEKFIIEKKLLSKNFFKLSIGKKRHLKIEII